MPSMQDKADLLKWVEEFPARENLHGYDEVLAACAARYGNTGDHLSVILDNYAEMFKTTMRKTIQAYRKEFAESPNEMPTIEHFSEIFDKSMRAILLRMWTYASEHYQRYQAAEVFAPLSDETLMQILGGNDGPKDSGSAGEGTQGKD